MSIKLSKILIHWHKLILTFYVADETPIRKKKVHTLYKHINGQFTSFSLVLLMLYLLEN